MSIRFTKMHGIGNDYVYINGFEQRVDNPPQVARKIADRNFGVGGDGLIIVLPPDKGVDAHVRMRMFNADGSESEMCGNGIRCVCKLAHDRGITRANPMKVQTGRGVLTLDYTTNGDGKVDRVTVDMGEPILDLKKIPVTKSALTRAGDGRAHQHCVQLGAEGAEIWFATFVSMGNPHAVFFDDNNAQIRGSKLKTIELDRLGPRIENHPAFPRRINVHLVQGHSRGELTMRTWERGTGMTLACGTGASAVCVAGALTNRTDREILAHLPGGDLNLRWDENSNHVFMTGPATEVFSGEWVENHA
ncbi:MAG: diaminopimelate epimerase [Phycisphaerales bacterium]|nr:diaminopimelate epimerase [Phycisphaerales bacterium]MCI0630563.1 diaminopimelate epimerase [Phycisphaerales bacterium]MCI0676000.1 diaminopimelate epimerase [Phycisphaerales bacterium]